MSGGINFNQNLGGIYWSNDKYINTVSSNGKEWIIHRAPFGHEFFVSDKSSLVITDTWLTHKASQGHQFLINNKSSLVITDTWLTCKASQGYEFFINNTSAFSITENGIYIRKNLIGNVNVEGDIKSRCTIGNSHWMGYNVIGLDTSHKYMINWLDGNLGFFVDNTCVDTLSDKRLKSDFGKIDDSFLEAVEELEIQQFKVINRNGKISFGIIAQDLIETFKRYNINVEDYEILGKVQYDLTNNIQYYKIEYIQFLVLKQLANDKKINKQQEEINQLKERDKQKDIIIQELIHRIETIEKEKSNGKN